jgi:hypothetical protein
MDDAAQKVKENRPSSPESLANGGGGGADRGSEFFGRAGRLGGEPAADRRESRFGQLEGKEAGREDEGAGEALLDKLGEHAGDLVRLPPGKHLAGALPVLPEVAQQVLQGAGPAPARGRIRQYGKRAGDGFAEDGVGAAIMFVEGRAADIGARDDVGHGDALLAAVTDQLVVGLDDRRAGAGRAAVAAGRSRGVSGQIDAPVR